MKKTKLLFLLLIPLIIGGCMPVTGDLSGFVADFNLVGSFEELSVSDFCTYTREELTSYVCFFENNGSEFLLTLSENDEYGRIGACSVTCEGIPDAENHTFFLALSRAVLTAYCGADEQSAAEIEAAVGLSDCTYSEEFLCESVTDDGYVYTLAYDSAGVSFMIESLRFHPQPEEKRPELTDYSQFFQTSGQ